MRLSLPIIWIHENTALLENAAEVKACHPLSLADAWIDACALIEGDDLVHETTTLEFPDYGAFSKEQ